MAKTKEKKKIRVIRPPKKIGGTFSEKAKQMLGSLPKMSLSDSDLINLAKKYKIPHFRGVFARDNLPSKPWFRERAILNLDSAKGKGTHWVCYMKNGHYVKFFDSAGNKGPPSDLVKYLKDCRISFVSKRYQDPETYICGHLCLLFLSNLLL